MIEFLKIYLFIKVCKINPLRSKMEISYIKNPYLRMHIIISKCFKNFTYNMINTDYIYFDSYIY